MKPPDRPCTVCRLRGQDIRATHVAASASGLEWYECGEHGPDEHVERRTGLVTIVDWFRRLPGFEG
jgi:hypothetical protein